MLVVVLAMLAILVVAAVVIASAAPDERREADRVNAGAAEVLPVLARDPDRAGRR